jgi:hypothetical protein
MCGVVNSPPPRARQAFGTTRSPSTAWPARHRRGARMSRTNLHLQQLQGNVSAKTNTAECNFCERATFPWKGYEFHRGCLDRPELPHSYGTLLSLEVVVPSRNHLECLILCHYHAVYVVCKSDTPQKLNKSLPSHMGHAHPRPRSQSRRRESAPPTR